MNGRPTGATLTVADIMTLDPVVIRADAPLEDAERLMRDRRISGLPVVDGFERLVGVDQPDGLPRRWQRVAGVPPASATDRPAGG